MQKEFFFRVLEIVTQHFRPWIEEQERLNMAHEEVMQWIREILIRPMYSYDELQPLYDWVRIVIVGPPA